MLLRKLFNKQNIFLLLIILIGFVFRIRHIEFGLPHSFHADEPEIAELAVKYTYELKAIIKNNDIYKLIPVSYVYGTVPAYFFTVFTMLYSKTSNILHISFDKASIYIFLRSLNSVLSLTLIPLIYFIFKERFKNTIDTESKTKLYALLCALLVALNWKLIVFAHYLNVDIFLTIFLTTSYLLILKYTNSTSDTKYTVLLGIFVGLAFGTKVTALLGLPFYMLVFLYKKEPRNMFAFFFVIIATFIITNPFSIAFMHDFAYRVYTLTTKENGLVFDSVDLGYSKSIHALSYISTPVIFLLSVLGFIKVVFTMARTKRIMITDIFFIGVSLTYIIFYAFGTRRVDRWLLPISPIILVYATYGFYIIKQNLNTYIFIPIVLVIFGYYSYFAYLTYIQFQKETPKSQAYIWAQKNLSKQSNKMVITEEGLDPMNKLPGTLVYKYNVYGSNNAQFFLAPSPIGYDYVIISSRPMQNYKNAVIRELYPFYYDSWKAFEDTLSDPSQFILIQRFELPKPNLNDLSDVYIYEATTYSK